MNPESPAQDVCPPAAGAPSGGGQLFTALLIGLGLVCLLMIGDMVVMRRAGLFANSRFVFEYTVFSQSFFLLVIIAAIVLRRFLPEQRRTIVIAVSVFILLHFPIGTGIGIYGLLKVDRSVQA